MLSVKIKKRERFIEVFAVIIFIVVIASFMLPKYMKPRDDFQKRVCGQAVIKWHQAMQSYKSKNGLYPTALNGLKFAKGNPLIANVLGEYTNVTENLEACGKTIFATVTYDKFIIAVNAKDRAATPFQAVFP